MALLEKIYMNAPIFVQNIMVSTKGYIQNKSRYGKEYYDYLKFLEKFEKLSYEEKRKYQFEELKKFIIYAYENSEFYRKFYEGIDIYSFTDFEDIKKLPLLDKETIRQNIDDIYTVGSAGTLQGHTSGTTGMALVVRYTKSDMMRRMASLDRFKQLSGFEHRKMKRSSFTNRIIVSRKQKNKIFWRYNVFCKQQLFSAHYITEENLKYYVKGLNKFKPDSIDGLFNALCDVASYIERHNIKLNFKPVAIFPTSETITENGRELLERVFGCKVYDQYASSEGAPFVTECHCGKLHMNMDTGYIENVSDDSDEIAVTSFTTHATPLIRYRIGDSMTFSEEIDCECGMSSITVKSILGRKSDYIYAADGSKITSVSVAGIFKKLPKSLIAAQLVQNTVGEVDMYLVVDKNVYNKDAGEKVIAEDFHNRYGKDTKLNIMYVDEIKRTSAGKRRTIINNVDKA